MNRWPALFLTLLVLVSSSMTPSAYPAPPSNPAKRKAARPNLDLSVYRRCYTPSEKVQMRLSGFNVPAVHFTAYRVDMGTVVRTSKTLEQFGKTLAALDLSRQSPAIAWRFPMGRIYPDQWAERAVTAPKLPPGAYLIQARAGGVEKRTWLAITRVALLAKRSRQELLVYATDASSG